MDPFSVSTAVRANQNRQALLEWLYSLDGRQRPDHPRHGVYTALHADTLHALGSAALAALAERWHQDASPQPGESLLLLLELDVRRVSGHTALRLNLDLSAERG